MVNIAEYVCNLQRAVQNDQFRLTERCSDPTNMNKWKYQQFHTSMVYLEQEAKRERGSAKLGSAASINFQLTLHP